MDAIRLNNNEPIGEEVSIEKSNSLKDTFYSLSFATLSKICFEERPKREKGSNNQYISFSEKF